MKEEIELMYCDKCRTYYEASLGTGLFCTCCIKKSKTKKEQITKAIEYAETYIQSISKKKK